MDGLEGQIRELRKEAGQVASRESMRTHGYQMRRKIDDLIRFLNRPGYHKDEYAREMAFLNGVKVGLESLDAYEDQFE